MKILFGVVAVFTLLVAIVEKGETQRTAKHCFVASVMGAVALQIIEIVAKMLG